MGKKFFSNSTSPVVETKAGKLQGFYFDGVYNFWGVRYAKAKRFGMPEPVKPWEGIKTALAYGMVCPLLDEPGPSDEVVVPHRFWPASEDCLNLNIWTPSIDREAKKPVMVWFHGGGYSAGSSIEHIAYEGDELARTQDVVVVGVNHRLNAFGHLDMSPFGEKYANSVNAGIVDLVASLQWVKENIAGFGGDPDNVTIFGQSGGGGKVTTLGQAAAADGLFHKAIVMSGIFDGDFGGGRPEVDPKEFVTEILKQLNLPEDDAEALEKVNTRLFIMAVNRATKKFVKEGKTVNWAPHPNEWYAGDPLEVGFREHYKTIPTMVGTCISEFAQARTGKDKSEMSEEEQKEVVYERFGKEDGDRLIALYKAAYPGKNLAYATALDYMSRPASMEYCRVKSEGEHANVYAYLFAQCFDYNNGTSAWHCADIPFFFANAKKIPYCYSIPNTEELNRKMSGAFAAFARSGDPNVEGIPYWEPVEADRTPCMIFDEEITLKADHDTELLKLAKEITPPFDFSAFIPKDDDEEEGKAWIY